MRTLILLPLAGVLACGLKTEPGQEPEASSDGSQEEAKSTKADSSPSVVPTIADVAPAKEVRFFPENQVMGKDGKATELSAEEWSFFGDVLVHVSTLPDVLCVSVEGYGFDGGRFYLKNVSRDCGDTGGLEHFSAGRLEYETYFESTATNTDSDTVFQVLPSSEGMFVVELNWLSAYNKEHEEVFMERKDFDKVGFSGPDWEKAESVAWSGRYDFRVWTKTPTGLKDIASTLLPAGVKTEGRAEGVSENRIMTDYSMGVSDSILVIGRTKYHWDGRRFLRKR
jgi:hypothetical protein